MSDLYTVLDVDPDGTPDGQHIEISTSLDDAKRRRDELQAMAVDDREAADFRVFQLVEPRVEPSFTRHDRVTALDYAVKCYIEESTEPEEMAGIVLAADKFAAFLNSGAVPAGDDDDEPSVPDIVVRRTNSGPRTVEVLVDGEVVARTDYDEGGWSGMDAVDHAATAIAAALDCPVRREEPEA